MAWDSNPWLSKSGLGYASPSLKPRVYRNFLLLCPQGDASLLLMWKVKMDSHLCCCLVQMAEKTFALCSTNLLLSFSASNRKKPDFGQTGDQLHWQLFFSPTVWRKDWSRQSSRLLLFSPLGISKRQSPSTWLADLSVSVWKVNSGLFPWNWPIEFSSLLLLPW